ncbi:MAG: sortase [Oscillospiraceae bacterium]|nr:sortase [Oscillospiraceae bacterium]
MSSHPKRSNRPLWIAVLCLSLALLVGLAIYWIYAHRQNQIDASKYHSTVPANSEPEPETETTAPTESPTTEPVASTAPETTSEPTSAPLQDNPVDFASLQAVNSDVYSWIYLPMGPDLSNIDYPILQARYEDDDNFYLHHDLNRNYLYAGCVYTQKANAKDYSDRVTVIYGHNMLDGTMFSNLVYFQNQDFFDQHEFFYIYTPGHILTYRIAAAIQFDTRHLLNCFDFNDDRIYENWIDTYVLHPKAMIRCVRDNVDVTIEDKLVILSTCLEHGASRFLIQGVLVSDEETN